MARHFLICLCLLALASCSEQPHPTPSVPDISSVPPPPSPQKDTAEADPYENNASKIVWEDLEEDKNLTASDQPRSRNFENDMHQSQNSPSQPLIIIHKTASCGCCTKWVDYLIQNHFNVAVITDDDLTPIKKKLRVPSHLSSCHTAEVNGMFVEGHVPVEDILKMLEVAPMSASPVRGIAVSGMPMGSPGMEMSGHTEPYQSILVFQNGEEIVFGEH